MPHPNETRLRELYALFATGNIPAFLESCTSDSTFSVPGKVAFAGTVTKDQFMDWIIGVLTRTGGTFREDVVDVFANDEHGILMLDHSFERDGKSRAYRTSHVIELRDGMISKWAEYPGSMAEFEDAWGLE